MDTDATCATTSVEEMDARIEEQLSVLASIDAQVVDRSLLMREGGLAPDDFHAWMIRASDARGHAASALVDLRHQRYKITRAEGSARVLAARLRAALAESRAETAAAVARAEAAEARMESHDADTIASLRAHIVTLEARVESGRDPVYYAQLCAAHGKKCKGLRESVYRAFLKGEVAVLRPNCAERFLHMTANGVPPEFRDAECARILADGYPPPRTSAECAASMTADREVPA